MIHLDQSSTSIVITCDDCPWWHGFQFELPKAEASGMRHEAEVHPDAPARFTKLVQTRARVRAHRARAAV